MPKAVNSDVVSASRSVARASRALASGGAVVLVDEASASADVVAAGADISSEVVSFMACEALGLVCLALPAEQVDRLCLRPQAPSWEHPPKAFTVSIDARNGITTGISAADRAHTIRTASGPGARAADLVVPGHIFPLRAASRSGPGQLGRTEMAVELVRLSGRGLGAAMCELLDDQGELAGSAFAWRFAQRYQLPVVSQQAVGLVVGAGVRSEPQRTPTAATSTALWR